MLTLMPWVGALICLGLSIGAWADRNHSRRERAILSLLSLLLAPMVFIVVSDLDAENRRRDQTLRSMNMIEYLQWWEQQGPQAPVLTAYTTSRVQLRAEPAATGAVIRVLGENAKVTLNDWQGDWFQGTVEDSTGWIDGRYLRPITYAEKDVFFVGALDGALKYTFPEETLTDKLIGVGVGWLIGVALSLAIHVFFRGNLYLEALSAAGPMAYFFVKNNWLMRYDPAELFLASWACILLGVVVSIPATLVVKLVTRKIED